MLQRHQSQNFECASNVIVFVVLLYHFCGIRFQLKIKTQLKVVRSNFLGKDALRICRRDIITNLCAVCIHTIYY